MITPTEMLDILTDTGLGIYDQRAMLACIERVLKAIEALDQEFFTELELMLAESDPDTVDAYDALISSVCSREPVEGPQWSIFALSLYVASPMAALLCHVSDSQALQAYVAEKLGLAPDRLRLSPLLLPATRCFDFGVVAAHHQARLARQAIVQGCQPSTLPRSAMNQWVPGVPRESNYIRRDECLMLFGIYGTEQEVEAACERFASIGTGDAVLNLALGFDIEGERRWVPAFPAKGGHFWDLACTGLHDIHVDSAVTLVDRIARCNRVPAESLRLYLTYVEAASEADDGHTVRLSLCDEDGELLAGFVAVNLHEPDMFLSKLRTQLERSHIYGLTVISETAFEAETDPGDGTAHFFVPQRGWLPAPEVEVV